MLLLGFTLLLAAISSVKATIAPTSPVASTVCVGGVICTISWIDDDTAPLATSFGRTSVGLYVGSTTEQTLIQNFGTIRNPATILEANYTIDATAGPDGDFYFIRLQSDSATSTSGEPLQAFSAQFTLSGMTGTLSAAASAEVAGISSSLTSTTSLASSSATTSSSSSTSTSSASTSISSTSTTFTSSSSDAPTGTENLSLASNVFVNNASSGAEHQTIGLTVVLFACLITVWLS